MSQSLPDGRGAYYDPIDLVDLAIQKGVAGIAFTYNEPTLYHEYIGEVGRFIHIRSKTHPLKLVLKSSGFATEKIIVDLCLDVDGFNIDLKGNEEDYESVCNGSLTAVEESIELIFQSHRHLEISYLVLPSRVYDIPFHIEMRDWLASLSCDIPVHLLYFYPFHDMANEKTYPPEELEGLHRLFSSKLNYVYVSNRYDNKLIKYRHTKCSVCGEILISRNSPAKLIKHSCCGMRIPGTFS